MAKPFVKWAGGKQQLLSQIIPRIPTDCTRYIEPFIGGGAVLFSIASRFEEIYISDTNLQLIGVYKDVRDHPDELTDYLKKYQDRYISGRQDERNEYYYAMRSRYNEIIKEPVVERSALFIFLNKTCYNGVYRVNSKGLLNIPAGRYTNPAICDEQNLFACSQILDGVHIECMPFEETLDLVTDKTFVYCDPPYRPLTQTAAFTSYTKDEFSDADQARLAEYARNVVKRSGKIMLSNSDPHNSNPADNFFDDLYSDFIIDRVPAKRYINSDATKRGQINEILIRSNYIPGEVTATL